MGSRNKKSVKSLRSSQIMIFIVHMYIAGFDEASNDSLATATTRILQSIVREIEYLEIAVS